MRLGDLGQLYDAVSDNWCGTDVASVSDILDFIKDSPTIAPETLPVVRELRAERNYFRHQWSLMEDHLEEAYKQIDKVTAERDAAIRHEYLEELKSIKEQSQDLNLLYIPKYLSDLIVSESMKLESQLRQVTAERDAAVNDIESVMMYNPNFPDTCQFCKNVKCQARGGTEPCIPKWRGIQEVQEDE